MNTRRITLGLGAAAGGLLAAAYLPMAVANAAPTDPFNFGDLFGGFGALGTTTGTTAASAFGFVDPSRENVLTVSGLPPLDQQVEGYQTFDFVGPGAAADAPSLGTVNTDVSTLTTPIGFTNTEYLVTGLDAPTRAQEALTGVTAPADLPTVGSTYDIASFDGFTNIYSSVAPEAATEPAKYLADSTTGIGGLTADLMGGGTAPAAAGDVVTDTFVTPFGSFDLTPFIGGFDASSGLAGDNFASLLDLGNISGGLLDGNSLLGVFEPGFAADISNLLTGFFGM